MDVVRCLAIGIVKRSYGRREGIGPSFIHNVGLFGGEEPLEMGKIGCGSIFEAL